MNFIRLTAGILAVTAAMAVSASAATLTTFNFDDASNGQKSYSKDGFLFDPTNFNSGQCFTPVEGGGNGSCFHEINNGGVTELTEDADDGFDLVSFFFNFEGQVTDPSGDNFFNVVGDNGDTATFNLFTDYTTVSYITIYEYFSDTQTLSGEVDYLDKGNDYFVVFGEDFLDGVTSIAFSPSSKARVRIDCVSVDPMASGSGITTEELLSCAPSMPPIPVPPALPLLAGGLGLLGILTRRKTTL